MQYFFKKNSPKKANNLKKYIVYRVFSKKALSTESIRKISEIINARTHSDIFKKGMRHSAVFYRSGFNSPWSSKTKDILDSCLSFTHYEIDRFLLFEYKNALSTSKDITYDPMTEIVVTSTKSIKQYLNLKLDIKKTTFKYISSKNISSANKKMGLAMSQLEIHYLENIYKRLKRNPTDVELMMFSQINSEHCRHKIFNSDFYINNKKMKKTLFSMIKSTNTNKNKDIVSAYSDNSSIVKGKSINELYIDKNKKYLIKKSPENYIIKAETHNHPTAISPYEGAATGSGGEIRDEGATGRGSTPKIGFCGYTL